MVTHTVDNLKAMICMDLIKKNVVTTDNVNLATNAYGPYAGELEGKTTRSRPRPVVRNIVEILCELTEVQKSVTVSMHKLTVNFLKLLSIIYRETYYRIVRYVTKPVASI